MAEGRFDLRGRTLREHAARGTLINGAFVVGVSLLAFLKGFVLAGLLDPEDYGVWGILLVGLGTLVWLKQVGIGDRYVQQDDPDQALAFQRAFTLEAIVNAVLGALIALLVPVLALVYDEPRLVAPGLVLVAVLPALTLQAPLWVLYRRMQFARQRLLQAVDPVVGFVVSVALAATGAGYWAFVIGTLAGVWASALVAVVACPYPLRFRLDRTTTREYVAFSGPLLAASLGGIVVAQGTVLAGQATAGLAAAGAITLAASITAFTNKVDDVLSDTLYPAICAVQDRPAVLFETFVKSNRLALMWAMPFGLGLLLFAPDLIDHVLGDRWEGATEVVQAFGFAAAIGHLGFNWKSYFMARGETRPIMVNSVLIAAAFVAIHLPLIIAEGLRGVWIGMVLLVVIDIAIRGAYLRRLFSGFALGRHALRALWPSVPAVGAVLAARAAGAGAIPELLLYVVVTVATTAGAERALIGEALGYLRRRPVTT